MNVIIGINENVDECAICFYPIITDKYVTDCSHSFHHTCLREWSFYLSKCPLCNMTINIPDFIIEIPPDEVARIKNVLSPELIIDLEYQKYQKQIKLERATKNNNSRLIGYELQHNCVVVTDCSGFVYVTGKSRRVLICCNTINTFVLVFYSENLFQAGIVLVVFGTSVAQRKNARELCCFPFLLKIVFILSSIMTQQLHNQYLFIFSCLTWIIFSLVK
jgi:hypothetical protein